MRKQLIFFAMTALFAVPAFAAEECSGTQMEMNICADRNFKEADAALNQVYQKGIGIVKGTKQEKNYIAVQRSWIKYRDLNCRYAADVYEGGTIAPLIFSNCMTKVTNERANEIPDLFVEWE